MSRVYQIKHRPQILQFRKKLTLRRNKKDGLKGGFKKEALKRDLIYKMTLMSLKMGVSKKGLGKRGFQLNFADLGAFWSALELRQEVGQS